MSSCTGIGFPWIFISGKRQAGIWCLHLSRMKGLSRGISEASPEELSLLETLQEFTQAFHFLANELFGLTRTYFSS